ncbi:glycine receptor subunit alpha-1 [Caerostris extrusa]|uniref:Glycine receptor subunit alpha-1 n=1 Tax=Caerostris extrusa TaxID=172846 RepID=A0AAV4XS56_CAEEX|nr:glycine receptor subunit alpha-1 [Caerostris extrusa]
MSDCRLVIRIFYFSAPQAVFPSDYNKYDAPGSPAHVYLDLSVMDVDRVDDGIMRRSLNTLRNSVFEQEFSIQTYIIEQWVDERLNLSTWVQSDEVNSLFPTVLAKDIWTPDLVFDNAKRGVLFGLSLPNTQIRVSRTGCLYRSSRYNLVIGCRMKFHFYPMDTQLCFLKLALLSNPDRKVLLHWAEEAVPPYRKTQSIVFTNDIQPLKYNLLPPSSYKTTEQWTAGNYTYLYANFTFVRRISSSLLNVYVPSTLVVFLSWISFWLDVAAVPARITLGVTSLLTLATQVVQARSGLPTISYMTAMDIWLFVCLLTVFGSLLEYAFTYQIYFVNRKHLASGSQASENISSDRQNRKDEVRSRNSSKVQMMSVTRPKRILEPKSTGRYFHPNERELDSYCRRLFPWFLEYLPSYIGVITFGSNELCCNTSGLKL